MKRNCRVTGATKVTYFTLSNCSKELEEKEVFEELYDKNLGLLMIGMSSGTLLFRHITGLGY